MKMPKGMRQKGRAFYAWRWVPHQHEASCEVGCLRRGREEWVALGREYREACRRLADLKREPRPVAVRPGAVAEVAELWLARWVARQRNAKGQALARQRVTSFLLPFFAGRVLRRIGKGDLERYAVWVAAQPFRGRAGVRGLSVQTQRHVLSDARCFFRWCVEQGFLGVSPVPRAWLPRVPERRPATLTEDEVARCEALPVPWGLVARVALATGLRWSELCRVEARHVERGLLVVERTKSYRLRRVPLPPALVEELRGHVGRIVPDVSYNRAVRRLRQLSGIAMLRPHQFRHAYAMRWLEAGGSLAALKETLGHRDATTTQIYAQLSERAVAVEAADVFEKLVEKSRRRSG